MNQQNYEEAIANAETAFSNGNYETALTWFKKALEESPDDLYALSRAGTMCVPLDKYDEAYEYFGRAMELDPENGDNAFNLGNAMFFRGEFDKSLELYAEAEMKGCSENVLPRLYYQMALLCSARQDVKSALLNFKKYEDADKTNTASMNPDVISEKLALYMMIQDYENAAKCAVQWIAVSPSELRGYMVYFGLLMAVRKLDEAEKALDDADKYAETDAAGKISIAIQRAALLAARAEADESQRDAYYQQSFELLNALSVDENATAQQRREIRTAFAELCMHMKKYEEAISAVIPLLPKNSDAKPPVPEAPAYEETDDYLTEDDTEYMIAEDVAAMEEKIYSGELSDNLGEYAEEYYDENGEIVREYPDGMFEQPVYAEDSDEEIQSDAAPAEEAVKGGYDRLYFILTSCYAALEDYSSCVVNAGILKHSENQYYEFFGKYAEAFSMKKLADAGISFTAEAAEKQYAEVIAYFRSRMIKGGSNYAVVFRARMYAETGKFAKADEMLGLLPASEKTAVAEYVEQCKKESQSM
ncbi:MAG: tetratricopeptide repeat protein [Ruminococcus sp.]|nr:tetratricopeptide repeat protein [Ruminococcus sp.]